jgi:hypothetical protein
MNMIADESFPAPINKQHIFITSQPHRFFRMGDVSQTDLSRRFTVPTVAQPASMSFIILDSVSVDPLEAKEVIA